MQSELWKMTYWLDMDYYIIDTASRIDNNNINNKNKKIVT